MARAHNTALWPQLTGALFDKRRHRPEPSPIFTLSLTPLLFAFRLLLLLRLPRAPFAPLAAFRSAALSARRRRPWDRVSVLFLGAGHRF